MAIVKIISIGDELGVVLPPESLKHLNVRVGDTLYLTEQANGIHLSSIEPEMRKAISCVMREHRDVLKRLADTEDPEHPV
ncbi:AbrB/MazE/SpoVT family DNA-binding domain-containing protein [Edaphobacter albus]|uniref:AbrB/MazE/SpoVT family DNA-binding domain-containing protein n=1 Tax=Edaphobacter sp. 4G125 TaxID=2763071 RepID=UPI0016469F07|nr:AbrB/MazE/SpoVT family DNA-binding domain-containing protein [Edaphobacter sp. 4G125]QNI36911.1 AbrB/MazE/SpoVT family DNA-binding domain-containing protein [Edaphobacter sp. 4G125]